MQIFSSVLENKQGLKTETWTFKKDGVSIFGDVKVMDIGADYNGNVVSVPVEEGSFFSYNKTSEPIKIGNTLAFQGTAQYLQSTLELLKKYRESLDTFSVITPYAEYENMTLARFSFTRDITNGEGLLLVKAEFEEILEVQVSYSSTDVSELPPPITDSADPSNESTQDTGMTAPTTPNSTNEGSAQRSRSILRDIKDSL